MSERYPWSKYERREDSNSPPENGQDLTKRVS